MKKLFKTGSGKSWPMGATVYKEGVNFSVFSRNAESVELLLFDREDHSTPVQVIALDPKVNRTFYYWHVFVKNCKPGQLYGYRVYGPYAPERGHRFDGSKVLIDPYARAVVTDTYSRHAAKAEGDNCAQAIKSVVIDPAAYEWEEDEPLDQTFKKSIIYELHVKGFTQHPNSGIPDALRGTYLGLIEKIPYLKRLGVTTVELMPVQQFDVQDVVDPNLTNYWGYAPIAFFAPHNGYCVSDDPVEQVNEFRDMVKALHRANIEVILDVTFNHTAEEGAEGPTLSFRGFENVAYYTLGEDMAQYMDYSGCGNTVKANHSIVRRLIRECLRHWVSEMHVDGFRFDLASILSRDEEGIPHKNPPILWSIESDPVLAPVKIIAEAWDIAHYQLGSFTGDKWAEWNGRFRDDVRRFMKGDEGMIKDMTQRMCASPDLWWGLERRDPNRSVNFVTCHDGFTLNDLVSYNHKYNFANGENNRDGTSANYSWNCGIEGPTGDPMVETLRIRQIKNFFTILLFSQGTPMFLMGDEVRRTQFGNNNAYCQDNEISWFDWSLVDQHQDLLLFVQKVIRYNLKSPFMQERSFWLAPPHINATEFQVHGIEPGNMDWGFYSHAFAVLLRNPLYDHELYIMVNAWEERLRFTLPEKEKGWYQFLNTAANPPTDFLDEKDAQFLKTNSFEVRPRSVVIAFSPNHKR